MTIIEKIINIINFIVLVFIILLLLFLFEKLSSKPNDSSATEIQKNDIELSEKQIIF